MKHCMLLSLLLALGCVHGAPVAQDGMEPGSCEDASALGATELALHKINLDRMEGYTFALHRLSNVHMAKHGENGMVFYLTLDVVETNCSVLSKMHWKACEARPDGLTPVYGQCKAAIYISKVNRVVRLYKYNCVVRPVPSARVHSICPDCPTIMSKDHEMIQKTVTLSLEKFNREGGLSKRFALLKLTRATAGMAMSMHYNVQYTIQETTCLSSAPATDLCPFLECEFTHNGFCKASLYKSPDGDEIQVDCEIYEPEASEREKKLHLLAEKADHQHNDTHAHSHTHDGPHAADQAHTHDHAHDHTKSHAKHNNSDHHHTHDHAAGSGNGHGHDHSHDHGHGHDHVHTHHAKAHNHTGDFPNQHHNYQHAPGVHTHEHDHELALDHDHKHAHLHDHEHHHHHHDHVNETTAHDHPEGMVRVLLAINQPMTLPAFPDVPDDGVEVGVTLPLKPDSRIPGVMEPTILPFPMTISANCPPAVGGRTLVDMLFSEDPRFKPAAKL